MRNKELNQHIYTYENIVIGGSLEALQFAYSTGYPLLCISQKPHFFRPKDAAQWEHLAFVLSLSGQLPLEDKITSIRMDEEARHVKCFTQNSRVVRFSYEVAHVVDDKGCEGLPAPRHQAKKEYLVFDWINVYRGGNHPYDYIEDQDSNFVKRILFYPSERGTARRADRKDACAVSVMTDAELKSLSHSESYILLKSRHMMEKAGLKGSKNGTQATTGKPAYLSLKIETVQRDKHLLHHNEYDDTNTIKFKNKVDKSDPEYYIRYLEYFLGSASGREKIRRRQNPSEQTQS